MRRLLYIFVIMLSCWSMAAAVESDTSRYIITKDSTSFIYYTIKDSVRSSCLPEWEDDFSVMELQTEAAKPLFTLPQNFRSTPNPRIAEVEIRGVDYYVDIPSDRTSKVYLLKGYLNITKYDSARFFLPFVNMDAGNYSISTFGIRAKYVKVAAPLKEHFHIDLYKNKIHEVYPWQIFFPLILAIVLILIAMFTQRGYISRLYLVIFYHNAFANLVGEKNVNADKAGYLLFASYVLNVALFAIVCLYRYSYQLSADFITSYFTLVMLVLLFYFVKRYVSKWMSTLFGCREVYTLYYKNTEYITHLLAVILMATNILSFYAPSMEIHSFVFYTTLFFCVLGEVMKIFRLFAIILEKRFPIFYLFLYLCGVEFLPVFLAIKMLSR